VGNFHGYPTDCPQREKNGWTGDALIAVETGLLNYRTEAAYTKWLDDIGDEQRETGELPGIVPTSGWGYEWGNGPCWDSAFILIPWNLYLYSGDTAVLEAHYEGMKRYVDYLSSKSFLDLVSLGLGDWVPPFGMPSDYTAPLTLLASSYYYADARTLSKIAAILGKDADAKTYRRLARKIRKSANRYLYDRPTGFFMNGTQTAQAAGLSQGLAKKKQRKKVAQQLVSEIERFEGRLNVGIHGAKFVMNALTDVGRPDIGYQLATQRAYPSWGHWMDQGATTLWEHWRGYSSHNHIMFGDISAWFFKTLAGIQVDPKHPGLKRVIIAPAPVDGLDWVRAEHESMFGTIRSAWEQDGERFRLEISVPPNSVAKVRLPTSDIQSVTEGDRPVDAAPGVTSVRVKKNRVLVAVESGDYVFECAVG
jgi:alpha-L-rhamnosidase